MLSILLFFSSLGAALADEGAGRPLVAAATSISPPSIEGLSDDDRDKALEAYAHAEKRAGTPCYEVMRKMSGDAYTRYNLEDVRGYLAKYNDRSACSSLGHGALETSLFVGNRTWSGWQPALQVMPSVGLGVPLGPIGSRNDAYVALSAIGGIQGGVTIRVTPRAYVFGGNLQFGTSQVNTSDLDPTLYPNPFVLVAGGGVEGLYGLISLNVLFVDLRDDGLAGESLSHTGVAMFKVDLTSIGVLIGPVVN